MATTAACLNAECSEYEVPKDFSTMPPGWTDPVYCGMCGDVIDISGLGGPEVDPPEANNELPPEGGGA